MKRTACILGQVFLVSLLACPSAAQIILPVAAENQLDTKNPQRVINPGSDLRVDREIHAYVRFDLSSLRPGTFVSQAIYRMALVGGGGRGSVEIRVVLEPWVEGLLPSQPLHGPAIASVELPRFQPLHGQAIPSVELPPLPESISIDLTQIVNDWLSGKRLNFGVAVVSSGASVILASKLSPTKNGPHLAVWKNLLSPMQEIPNPLDYPAGSSNCPTTTDRRGPYGVAFDGANVWVANDADDRVIKLRASDGILLGTFPLSKPPWPPASKPIGVVFDGTHIWVANFGTHNVSKLQASDGDVVGVFPVGRSTNLNPLGNRPVLMAFDGTSVWVANSGDDSVSQVNPSDGTRTDFPVGTRPNGVAFGGASIWVTNRGSNTVPSSVTRLPLGSVDPNATFVDPIAIAYDETNIWVANFDGSLTRLRASDGEFVDKIILVDKVIFGTPRPRGMAFDGKNMWVALAGESSNRVAKVRASDGVPLETVLVGGDPRFIAFDGANMWITNHCSGTVSKRPAFPN